jgi:hypothetical protein
MTHWRCWISCFVFRSTLSFIYLLIFICFLNNDVTRHRIVTKYTFGINMEANVTNLVKNYLSCRLPEPEGSKFQFAKTVNRPDPKLFPFSSQPYLLSRLWSTKCYSFTLPSVLSLSQEFLLCFFYKVMCAFRILPDARLNYHQISICHL